MGVNGRGRIPCSDFRTPPHHGLRRLRKMVSGLDALHQRAPAPDVRRDARWGRHRLAEPRQHRARPGAAARARRPAGARAWHRGRGVGRRPYGPGWRSDGRGGRRHRRVAKPPGGALLDRHSVESATGEPHHARERQPGHGQAGRHHRRRGPAAPRGSAARARCGDRTLLDNGTIVLVPPIGYSTSGAPTC